VSIQPRLALLALIFLPVVTGYGGPLVAADGVRASTNAGQVCIDRLSTGHWTKIHQQQPGDLVRFARPRHGGATFDTRRGRIVLYGSDTHGHDWSNSPVYFDMRTLAWQRAYPNDAPNTCRITRDGIAVAGKNGNHPWAMHTFDAVEYDSRRDELIIASYPQHLTPGRFTDAMAKLWPKIKHHATWTFSLSTQTWRPLPIEPVHFFPYATAYDSHRGVVIGYRDDGIYELGGEPRMWRKVTGPGLLGYHNNAVYDSVNRALVVFGSNENSNDIVIYKPATAAHRKMPTPGIRPPKSQHVPLAFHEKIGKTIVLVTAKSTNARTETWLYDLANDRWQKHPSANLPLRLGMNYNLVYDAEHNMLLLVTGEKNEATAVWVLNL